jgi:hypothetical protein
MRTHRWRSLLVGALLLAAVGAIPVAYADAGSPESPTSGSAEPVLTWNLVAHDAITAGGRPPGSTFVQLAIMHTAIYDTAVALGLRERHIVTHQVAPHGTSAAAAIATAAHDVLVARVPAQQTTVNEKYAVYMAGISEGAAKDQGTELGARIAALVLQWRAADGFDAGVAWQQPTPGPGVWEASPGSLPVDVVLTGVRPLTLKSADQFRPAGPPALTSEEYAKDFAEVARLGRIDSLDRTIEQKETAVFWQEHGAMLWNRAWRQLVIDQQLNLGEAARLLAMLTISAGDAAIACWDSKFYELAWRPLHAIPRADTDGNPATVADPTWKPLQLANHPEYPSGHACVSSATVAVLHEFFGRDDVTFSIYSATGKTTRTYDSFSAALAEVNEARILGGLHFRFSMNDGIRLGTDVAGWALRTTFS